VQPIAVLGAGSWGTALALHLARLGQPVRLWSFEADHVIEMQRDRTNKRYLPTQAFPQTLQPVVKLEDALSDVHDILITVPSIGFRSTLFLLQAFLQPTMRIVWATKGLDEQTGGLLHEVAQHILGDKSSFAVLSGPSFAKEVAANLPTAVVIASHNQTFAKDLQQRFNGQFFRVYLSQDMIGVEIGGVVKNVLAIATGISDGMGFGANARSALITRGIAEMVRLGIALGGQYETFYGLTGLGDVVLTCTDDQSRNRRFGLLLGKGLSPAAAEKEIKQVVEGKRNTELVMMLANNMLVEMPIVETVFHILQGKMTPKDAMQYLLSRTLKAE
jgi:glycerol-3-phosphate dehydrogenase (NAD(P)+)